MESSFSKTIRTPSVLGNVHSEYLEFLKALVLQDDTSDAVSPRIVVIRGQSGIGKTHIVRELYEWLVLRQEDPGYWPSLDSSEPLDSTVLDPFFLRKRIGPSPNHFTWKSGALPTFGWWSISCQRGASPSIGQSLADLERQLNAHMLPLSLSWGQRVGLCGELLTSVKAGWQDRLQEILQEGTLEGVTSALASLGLTLPGVGLAVEYAASGVRALARRGSARRALGTDGELPIDSPVTSIVEQMRRFTDTSFPMIVAIEDLQWADETVVELLTHLLLDNEQSPRPTVIATCWPDTAPDRPCAPLLDRLQQVGVLRYLELNALEPQALHRLIVQSAPRTDPDTVRLLASRWPNPYALKLALADRRLRDSLVDGAYVLSVEDLDLVPITVADLYRNRWRELPDLERIVLAVGAASGLRDEVTCNVSFSDALTARIIEETEFGRSLISYQEGRGSTLAALERTEEPLRWTRSTPDDTRIFIEPDAASVAREELSLKEIDRVVDATRTAASGLLLSEENPTIAAIYLQHCPDDANTHEAGLARLMVAKTSVEEERYSEAAALFETVAKMQDSDSICSRFTALCLAGHSHIRAGDFGRAAAVFRSASMNAVPGSADAAVTRELLSGLWVTTRISADITSEPLFDLIRHRSSDSIGLRVWAREYGTEKWTELVEEQTTTVQMSSLSSDLDIRIECQNQSESQLRNTVVRSYFDEGVRYIERSTHLKNATHPSGRGLTFESDIMSSIGGLDIGHYSPKANALLYFSVSLSDASTRHHLVVDAQADSGRSIIARRFRISQSDIHSSVPHRLPRHPWGPNRPVFAVDGSDGFQRAPIFNSIYNNPNYGDERQFVTAKDSSHLRAGGWQTELRVTPGRSYIMRIYINNSASDRAAVASTNTRVKVVIPNQPGMTHLVWGLVTADNSSPESVYSSVSVYAEQPVVLSFISGSARLYNNMRPREGFPLPDSIAISGGALIGYTDIDGVILPGYQYSSIVTLRFSVHAAE